MSGRLRFAIALLLLCATPAHAFHCQPKPGDWNDERTIAVSRSLPGGIYVSRCRGSIEDFEWPSCMRAENIYDAVPCPEQVLALATVLRAENAIDEERPADASPSLNDARKGQALLSDAQRERLLEKIKEQAEKRAGGSYDSPSAAPWFGAYRLKDGSIKMDAGGSMAIEKWDCRFIHGRQCFVGVTAGKETVGLAVGFGLRSAAAIAATADGRAKWQLVPNVGFVMPYASAGAQASPCLGVSIKIW